MFLSRIKKCPLLINIAKRHILSVNETNFQSKSQITYFNNKNPHNSIARMSTESTSAAKPTSSNRLIDEKSPYLLQHAQNPVHWFPWGPEAFTKAKLENKPIFLSVGYSTCHWCHVMERESFENEDVAKVLNEHYVSIKVDREERPDVDKVYMAYVQRTTGSGGWPMSVFLTPSLEPLFGGTYFPPEDAYGRIGFKSLLEMIAKQWSEQHGILSKEAKQSVTKLKTILSSKLSSASKTQMPHKECWQKCYQQINRSYEAEHGGFSPQPKFPQPTIFNFLYHIYYRKKNTYEGAKALEMVLHTLKKMAYGGIHDHVGSGFSRYSVDKTWHVPHFEKMLYDQAQLVCSYATAYTITKDRFFKSVAEDILVYVSRDLSHPEGGFYGAEDADSLPTHSSTIKKEGAFYVWTYLELRDVIKDQKKFDVFCSHFNVKRNGNVDPKIDQHRELENKNVLCCFGSLEETASKNQMTVEHVEEILKECCEALYETRKSRPRPSTDTKIITAWNGLMISGYAQTGFALKSQDHVDRAIKAADFVRKHLFDERTGLLRCCYHGDQGSQTVQTGENPIAGFLDDYAFLIRGLIDLYEATLDCAWLQWAETLQIMQNEKFLDTVGGAYFTTNDEDEFIIIRDKEDQDGAEPCGNSVSVHNLLRLSAYLDRKDFHELADKTLKSYGDRLKAIPFALPEMTSALMSFHSTPVQIFIAGDKSARDTDRLLDVVRSHYIPGRILALADGVVDGSSQLLYERHKNFANMHPVHGNAAAYVCRNFACSLPVTDVGEFDASLDSAALHAKSQSEYTSDSD